MGCTSSSSSSSIAAASSSRTAQCSEESFSDKDIHHKEGTTASSALIDAKNTAAFADGASPTTSHDRIVVNEDRLSTIQTQPMAGGKEQNAQKEGGGERDEEEEGVTTNKNKGVSFAPVTEEQDVDPSTHTAVTRHNNPLSVTTALSSHRQSVASSEVSFFSAPRTPLLGDTDDDDSTASSAGGGGGYRSPQEQRQSEMVYQNPLSSLTFEEGLAVEGEEHPPLNILLLEEDPNKKHTQTGGGGPRVVGHGKRRSALFTGHSRRLPSVVASSAFSSTGIVFYENDRPNVEASSASQKTSRTRSVVSLPFSRLTPTTTTEADGDGDDDRSASEVAAAAGGDDEVDSPHRSEDPSRTYSKMSSMGELCDEPPDAQWWSGYTLPEKQARFSIDFFFTFSSCSATLHPHRRSCGLQSETGMLRRWQVPQLKT